MSKEFAEKAAQVEAAQLTAQEVVIPPALPHAAPQQQSIHVNVAPELSATISALASAAMRSLVAPANPHHPHHTNAERMGLMEEVSVSASTSSAASASSGSSS